VMISTPDRGIVLKIENRRSECRALHLVVREAECLTHWDLFPSDGVAFHDYVVRTEVREEETSLRNGKQKWFN